LGVRIPPGAHKPAAQQPPPRPCSAQAAWTRERSDNLLGDKRYSYTNWRALLPRRGIGHTGPERSDQRVTVGAARPRWDRERYRHRNVVEHGINRLNYCRAASTWHDERAANHHTSVALAALLLRLRA
jgi:hypothetical protein